MVTITNPKPQTRTAAALLHYLCNHENTLVPVVFVREHVYVEKPGDGWYATTMSAHRAHTSTRVNLLHVATPIHTLILSETSQQLNVVRSKINTLAHTPFHNHVLGTYALRDVQHLGVRGSALYRNFVPIYGRESVLKQVANPADGLRLLSNDLEHLAHACDPVTGVALRIIQASR